MTTSISINFDSPCETFLISATAEVYYQPCEKATRDYPGCDATLEIESLTDDKTGESILITESLKLMVEDAMNEYLISEKGGYEVDRYESMRD